MTTVSVFSELKVIEYGEFVSAPYCVKQFADMGAEVIKIEKPHIGDSARAAGPFPKDTYDPEKSGLFLHLNTNKMGITLNPETNNGAKIFRELISQADILIENNAPRSMERLGFTFESLHKINPRLIMTSITPFGQSGPYHDFKATELIVYQMSGIGYATPGRVEDPSVSPPLWGRASLAGFIGGMAATAGTLHALIHRDTTGTGLHVDISIQEVCASVCLTNLSSLFYQGLNPTRLKIGSGIPAPAHILAARDGYINLECLEEQQWTTFIEAMGNPDWAKEEVFKDRFARGEFWDALEPLITEITLQWDKNELSSFLQARGVPCTPVNTMADLLESPQLADREFFQEMDHPVAGKLKHLGFPFNLSRTPCEIRSPAPLLGQHNRQVFCDRLGYEQNELLRMKQTNTI